MLANIKIHLPRPLGSVDDYLGLLRAGDLER
jgi:hypothetical protein